MTGSKTVEKEKQFGRNKLTTSLSLSSKRQDDGKDGFVLYYFDSDFFSVGDKGSVHGRQTHSQTEEQTGK